MGLYAVSPSSSSSFDRNSNDPMPNPKKFTILRDSVIGKWLIIKINYPDCKNYEGDKILVYWNCSVDDLIKQGAIDPHFSDNKEFHSPFARFRPDEIGWDAAIWFVQSTIESNNDLNHKTGQVT